MDTLRLFSVGGAYGDTLQDSRWEFLALHLKAILGHSFTLQSAHFGPLVSFGGRFSEALLTVSPFNLRAGRTKARPRGWQAAFAKP